jgi:hypothetical protein
VLVKSTLSPLAYKHLQEADLEVEEDETVDRTVGTCKTMFESPCFFCAKLETCGEDAIINYFNCPRLNDFISKPL